MSDIPVLVVDVGSASLKAGYAGDDSPVTVIPSTAQKCAKGMEVMEDPGFGNDESEFESRKSFHPVQRGLVKDWEMLESLWRIMLDDIGIVSSDTTSVMITESPVASPADRSKWAEMLFESYRVPSIYIANSSSLSLFASGRTTGLVVESGAGVTSTVPVFEGLALQHAATTVNYAGQDVSEKVKSLLWEKDISVDLGYARMLKERMAYVRTDTASRSNQDNVNFSLPDGTDVSASGNIFGDCTEKLFFNIDAEPNGLVHQANESLQLCDDSLQKDLANNVVISGGTSMLPGFGDRLESEMTKLVKKNATRSQRNLKVRVIPSSSHREAGYTSQRKTAAWIGGSIISSLDTFKQIKITRQEWEEDPDACVRTKFV
mmetsp:Transcript_5450/g.8979  ORF Transcript_5450/g.8979 Transcript_5450/m.8979 type:complete len:375 (-) Transcript_5450:367-1491(-)|eukprot:CAMPEP_0114423784 /NCGR_PEP_ID=MMETSP0103-20121206/6337_1 /TAXON_ID=37642 ORGANISM="Paraphysomonas imperforata, Strain PA2" /NCGR_SAMPLE_ID=MMETSP0103 /ASSEMBLY_ACC=CAM_ASM_000201 /LENGTH=374 /DNA_ID=CAMNT_0001592477 /DNA_START=59 /DNA_END=1183 /DNA_ORIENTATION=+